MPSQAQKTRRDVLILIALVAIVTIPSLLTRDPWNPDEPRYTEVGRAMLARGTVADYFVPHLNGEVYRQKPPVFFALTALIWRLGGGVDSGRILAAICSLVTVLLTYSLARRMLPRPGPMLAAVCTLACLLFVSYSKMGVLDTVLTTWTTAAIVCGFHALHSEGKHTNRWWLAAYACTGMAILIKGHPGVITPLLVLLVYAFINRKTSRGGWVHLWGFLLMVAFPAAWLVPAGAMVGWDYVYGLVVKQAAGRAVKSYSHQGPFWDYLMESPWMAFPWFLLIWLAAVSAFKAWRKSRDTAALFPLVWLAAPFLLFSAISGKRPGYILPLVPAVGLLMARYGMQGVRQAWPWPKLHKAFLTITLTLLAAITLCYTAMLGALVFASDKLMESAPEEYAAEVQDMLGRISPGVLGTGFALALGLFVVIVWAVWRSAAKGGLLPIWMLAGLVIALNLHVDCFAMPEANTFKSGRNFAIAAKPYVEQAEEVYQFRDDFSGVYNLYLEVEAMPSIEDWGEFQRLMARPTRTAFITRAKRHSAEEFPLDAYHIAVEQRVGHRMILLVTNWTDDKPVTPPEAN